MLTKGPSSTIVQCTLLSHAFTIIWNGIQEGRCGSVSLFQSKEMTLLFGGGSVEMGEMPPCELESEVTRRT